MSLVTVDEWSDYASVPAPSNLAKLLAGVSSAVTTYCEWGIAREVVEDEVLDGSGTWLLKLPTMHLLSVESVSIDDVELAESEYRFSKAGLLDRRPFIWPEGFGRVKVSFTHGFDPVPEDVKSLVVSVVLAGRAARPGVKALAVGGMKTEWFEGASTTALSDLDRVALDKYRI